MNSILRNNIFPSINSFNQVELQLTQGQIKMGMSPRKDRTYSFWVIKHRFRHRYRLAVHYIWCPEMTFCFFSNRLSSVTLGSKSELHTSPPWLQKAFNSSWTTPQSTELDIDGRNYFLLDMNSDSRREINLNLALRLPMLLQTRANELVLKS